jgi:hypothetical protein
MAFGILVVEEIGATVGINNCYNETIMEDMMKLAVWFLKSST